MNLRRSACSLTAATLTVASRIAFANAAPSIVRVYVAGPAEAVSGARDAVQDLCSRSNVAVVVQDAAGADEALLSTKHAPSLAEAYVDLRAGWPTRVVVVDGDTRQDLERRSLPEGSSLEISIETVARVVCSAVESSLAARSGSAAASAPAPRRVEPGSDWAPRLAAFGALENFGAGFHGGGGASLGITHGRSGLRAGALLSVAGFASADVQAASALASFGLLGVRLLPMLEWRVANDLTAFAAAGGGGDWTRIGAERSPVGGVVSGAGPTLDAIGSCMLGVRLRLTSSLSVLVALDADLDLTRHRYVILSAEGSRVLFEPARVRPMALAGLSWSFGGPSSDDAPTRLEERR